MGETHHYSPAHRSWSQLNAYQTCGHRFQLERILGVPQRPSWAALAGKAIHVATESVDRDGTDPELAWIQAWNDELAIQTKHAEYPQSEWYVGGRKSKDWPDKETPTFWLQEGPIHVARWKAWREGNPDWKLMDVPFLHDYITPEGDPDTDYDLAPAIEWGATVWFRTNMIKAFIDRIFINPDGEVVVVDIKSGTFTPEPLQLGIYAAVMEKAGLPRPKWGAFFKTRQGVMTEPADLDRFTVEFWADQFDVLERGVEHGVFPANPGNSLCGSCSVKQWCVPMGGTTYNPAENLVKGK